MGDNRLHPSGGSQLYRLIYAKKTTDPTEIAVASFGDYYDKLSAEKELHAAGGKMPMPAIYGIQDAQPVATVTTDQKQPTPNDQGSRPSQVADSQPSHQAEIRASRSRRRPRGPAVARDAPADCRNKLGDRR